jgi:hypothetical protein
MLGSGRCPARLRSGALLALAAGWLCAPAALQASCGDYVHLGNAVSAPPAPALPPIHRTDTPRPSRPAPCHGPGCSGGSRLPLAPPTLARTAPDQWGDLAQPLTPEGQERCAWFAVPQLRHLPGDASSIFHPPRTAAHTTCLF